mgnify:CR=1 FL=1
MKINLKVIKNRKLYLGISTVMVLISLISLFTIKLNLGVDFKGGELIQLKYSKKIDQNAVNRTLNSLIGKIPQMKAKRVQFSDTDNTVIIRTEQMSSTQKAKVMSELKQNTGKFEVVKNETVGAVIGKELTANAFQALLIGSILIVIYITVRFEFIYAIAGIAALIHDVIIAFGVITMLRYEIDTPFIAAILTILGYSINDTIVVFDGKVLGKPHSKDEARTMLRTLSGQVHSVITGVALLIKGREIVFHNETKVYFKTLQDFEIESYIDSLEPMDKAGAYGIQGKGALWVDKIEGSYTNVVGLPVEHVYEELCKALGVKS